MPMLKQYLCSYYLSSSHVAYYFECMADDEYHAIEQLLDSEPHAREITCQVKEPDPDTTSWGPRCATYPDHD